MPRLVVVVAACGKRRLVINWEGSKSMLKGAPEARGLQKQEGSRSKIRSRFWIVVFK
jgi:hypothetical protein